MKNELKKRLISSLVIIPLTFFFIIKGSYLFNIFLCVCLFIAFYEWYLISKRYKYQLFGYILLCVSFYCVFCLRNDFGDKSLIFFLFVLLVCIFTDLGGYLFGNIFKGPKITRISPNKTYSGVIGGYICSFIIIFLVFEYSDLLFDINLKSSIETFIYVAFISTVSQIGDLIISYFKRLSKIKDTGKIIPGHGGILDRIDGMIFAFPFSYLVFNINTLTF
tara:strand:- start:1133 stop:1792 length:660 start_codon:yes stop_codon:yes gene_type:complete